MGLIPSINRDVMALAERAVTALERIADAAEARPEHDSRRRWDTDPSTNDLRRQLGLPLVGEDEGSRR